MSTSNRRRGSIDCSSGLRKGRWRGMRGHWCNVMMFREWNSRRGSSHSNSGFRKGMEEEEEEELAVTSCCLLCSGRIVEAEFDFVSGCAGKEEEECERSVTTIVCSGRIVKEEFVVVENLFVQKEKQNWTDLLVRQRHLQEGQRRERDLVWQHTQSLHFLPEGEWETAFLSHQAAHEG